MATTTKGKSKRAILHMKIDQTLKLQLMRMAREQNRTLANLVETVMRDYARRTES